MGLVLLGGLNGKESSEEGCYEELKCEAVKR
jgi:hypothetical protein